jgi:hypothetical protein
MSSFGNSELAAQRDAQGELAGSIGEEFPRQAQQIGIAAGDCQLARLRRGEECVERGAVGGRREDRVVQPPSPSGQLGLDLLCPNHGAAVGQLHVFLEIPAQLLVVGVAQEGGEGLLDADRCAVAVGQRDALAAFCCGCEEQANFVLGGEASACAGPVVKKAAGGGAGSGQELARTTASSSADSWRMARAP